MKRIPIMLITGFLGSGKTTFINSLLKNKPDLKISLILNEFGDVSLESQFIQSHKDDVIELSNGCMCCVAQNDFERVINWIITERPQTEYIIIEASGLSDPLPIATVLRESSVQERAYLDAIVGIVDATNFFEMKASYPTVMVQLSNSDIVLISKPSLSTDESIAKISDFIHYFMPRVSVFEISDSLNYDLLIDTQLYDPTTEIEPHSHTHSAIDVLFWKSPAALDFERMSQFLRTLPPSVIRAKGALAISERGMPAKKYLLQYVGQRSEISESNFEPHETVMNALVLIGESLDKSLLTSQLESCTVQNVAME